MENFNQPSIIVISSQKILGILSDNWRNFAEIQKELKIDDMLDKRYLKLKLKELVRKKLIESKKLAGNICYKKVESSQIKKSCSEEANRLPLTVVSSEKTLETKNKNTKFKPIHQKSIGKIRLSKSTSFDFSLYINRMFKFKDSINFYKKLLKIKPDDNHVKNLLKKARKSYQTTKRELENNSYFICLDCKKFFANRKRLIEHAKIKHDKWAFNCLFCNAKFISESDFKVHEKSHELDLHGLYVKEANIYVTGELIRCREKGFKGIKIVHGYRHGHSLRDYFRSQIFIDEMKKTGFNIKIVRISKPGETCIVFL